MLSSVNRPMPTRASDLGNWAPLVLFLVGIFAVAMPQIGFFSALPGDIGDTRFNAVVLEHLFRWCIGEDQSLWSPNFFYPLHGALAFSDNHLGTGIVYVIARLAGAGTWVAYDVWFSLGYVVNFWATYYAMRKLGFSKLASAIGSFIFSFSLPVTAQGGHAQLGYRWPIPLAIATWLIFLEQKRVTQLGWCVAFVCAAFLNSIYLGYFLVLVLVAYVIASYIQRWIMRSATALPHWSIITAFRQASWRDIASTALVMGLSAAVIALLIRPYLHYARLYEFSRSSYEIFTMLPRVASYFIADNSLIWHSFSEEFQGLISRNEHQLFFGLATILLLVAGILPRSTNRSRFASTSGIALTIIVALTLCVFGHASYMELAALPGANAIRAVGRIVLVLSFPLALVAGAGVERIAGTGKISPMRWIALGSITLFMIVEFASIVPSTLMIAEAERRTDAAISLFPQKLIKPDTVIFIPIADDSPSFFQELDALTAAQRLHVATLNGYSGNFPPGYAGEQGDACVQVQKRIASARRFRPVEAKTLPSNVLIARGLDCSLTTTAK